MGTQSTAYILKDAAYKTIKKELKRKGWWKEVKEIVKSLDDRELGYLLDRVCDNSFENYIVCDTFLEQDELQMYSSPVTPAKHGYYNKFTIDNIKSL